MPEQVANKLKSIISKNIKKCRLKAFPGHGGGRRCAAAFGVTPSQWSHWENNRRIPDEYIRSQLAVFFGIPESEFVKPSFAADTVAVKESPPLRDCRQMNALGVIPAALPENVMAELAGRIAKFAVPEVSSRLAEQIAPAVIDKIAAQVTPAIVSEICRKIAGIPLTTAGGLRGKAVAGKIRPRPVRPSK